MPSVSSITRPDRKPRLRYRLRRRSMSSSFEYERVSKARMLAHELQAANIDAVSGVRDLAVGRWFEFTGHPEIDTRPQEQRQFIVTRLHHRGENSLPKELDERAQLLLEANRWRFDALLPNTQAASNNSKTAVETRYENTFNFDGKYKRVLVGAPPARVPIREAYERLSVGPEAGWSLLGSAKAQAVNAATQVSHTRNDIRFINGEELKPPCDPDLYGGEVVRGGPKPGYADRAGQVAPDDVLMDVALGNKYASFEWQTVEHTLLPVLSVDKYKEAFNANKDVNDQSQNWRVRPRTLLPGFTVEREETPNETRKRMKTDPDARDDNNYHSAVSHSPENHRWVTAMDVAIGQAVSLDDPDWRDLLIRMGDWKLNPLPRLSWS